MNSLPLPPVARVLQINMCPTDIGHVQHCLPHQLRIFENQVDRIHLTVDLGIVSSGRYRDDNREARAKQLLAYLNEMQAKHPNIHIDMVDYSEAGRALVQETFFSQLDEAYPIKAFDGGPFHVYFWGMARCNAGHIFHMDSDMLFGGGSQTWLSEAIALQEQHREALFIAPLGGPPLSLGNLATFHHHQTAYATEDQTLTLVSEDPLTIAYQSVSTRLFLIDMQRFADEVRSLQLLAPKFKGRLRAQLLHEDKRCRAAEDMLSHLLASSRYRRFDFLGTGDGLYSLHPTYRSADFYRNLPKLIARIESGDIPQAQRGDHDINQSMQDWHSALAERTKLKRLRKAMKHLVSANWQRLKP